MCSSVVAIDPSDWQEGVYPSFCCQPCISDVTIRIFPTGAVGVEAVPDVVAVPVNPDDLSVVVDSQSFSAVRAVGINLSCMGLLSGSVSEPKVPPLPCRSWETVPTC